MAILSPVAPWSPSDPLPNRAPDRFRNHFKNMRRGAVRVRDLVAVEGGQRGGHHERGCDDVHQNDLLVKVLLGEQDTVD